MRRRLECTIYGRVQLVMFRDFTQRNASRIGLTGRVWNKHDGTVQFVAEGEQEQLKELLRRVTRGPVLARVDRVEEEWVNPTGEYSDFRISYT